MAHTDSDHTQHVARMHRHRRNVHAATAQLTADAVQTVADHYGRVEQENTATANSGPPTEETA